MTQRFRPHIRSLFFLLAFLFTGLVPGIGVAEDAKVEFSVTFEPEAPRVGEAVVLDVNAKIPAGYHLYSMRKIDGPLPLKIAIEGEGLEAIGEWYAPDAKTEHYPNFEIDVEYYDVEVTHQRALRVTAAAASGPVVIKVKGQICTDGQCILVGEDIEVPLVLGNVAMRAEFKQPPALEGSSSGALAPDGMWTFIIVAFGFGIAAVFTPCVFPMIPITVSYFSKFAAVSMRRAVIMASVYAMSMIGTFVFLGLLVSLLFGAAAMQGFVASMGFNVFLFVLLIVFAFNLFGLFEISMPSWLVNRTAAKEQELTSGDGSLIGQAAGVFFMGLTFSLVSFTCTFAFIGNVFVAAANGEWFFPMVGMAAFSTAFAAPFFLLAIFPAWAEKLRGKGGDWMVALKVVMGFIELAGSLKFLSNIDLILEWEVVTRSVVLSLWTGIFVATALFLFRVFQLTHCDDSRRLGPIRMVIGILFLSTAVFASTGIRDTASMGGWVDGWLPPAVYPGDEEHHVNDIPGGMADGISTHRPVFVDYTGLSCTNCRTMESGMFTRPEIEARLNQMVRVSAYTDCEQQVCDDQRLSQIERYKTAALPFYAILNPYDDTVLATFADMTNDEDKYQAFLQGALNKWAKLKKAETGIDTAAAKAVEDSVHGTATPDAAVPHTDQPAIEFKRWAEPVDIELPVLGSDETTKLSSLRGDWVLLNFWASWCGPCKKELKGDFPNAFTKFPDVKLVTIAFEEDDDGVAEAIKFLAESGHTDGLNFRGPGALDDANLPDSISTGKSNLPQSFLIDPEGYVVWRTSDVLHQVQLEALLAHRGK